MPKTIKSKSTRKALSNISNHTYPPNHTKTNVKQQKQEAEAQAHNNNNGSDDNDNNSALDRLHVVHASLSELIQQIDGLVTCAHKLNLAHKLGVCDLECFIKVLSAAHFTLQGWLPKFEQAFGSHSVTAEKQTLPSSPTFSSSVVHDENLFPLDNFRKSLSPSPLVSWPLGIISDCGRDLFALTPLPKSRTCTDFKRFSALELIESGDKGGLAILKTPLPSQHPSKTPEQIVAVTPRKMETASPPQVEAVTPQIPPSLVSKYSQIFRGNQSHFVKEDPSKIFATPGLELSPPKTCLLMRPISKSLQCEQDDSVQSTPPVTVNFRKFDESPSSNELDSQIPKSLRVKYPDLFKRAAYDCIPIKTSVQMSPQLGMSPPKTCVLMIPSSEVLLDSQGVSDLHKSHERDKSSSLSDIPVSLSISKDFPQPGKNGEFSKQRNPTEEGLMAKHPDFLCQALEVPTLSFKMNQTKEGAKKSPELCETTSTSRVVHKNNSDLCCMPRALDNSCYEFPRFSMSESTPASKVAPANVENTEQRGKQPGEQTLRRELWSQLKAASADAYPKGRQDFLVKLQEASIEENSRTNGASHISSLAKSISSRKEGINVQRSIALARSATRVSVTESVQRSSTRDRLQEVGDLPVLDPMKRLQAGKSSKIDSSKMRTTRLQQKAKQANETSYSAHLHASER